MDVRNAWWACRPGVQLPPTPPRPKLQKVLPPECIVREVGRLGDGRGLYLFSDDTIRTEDGRFP
jgi:hypothetical protein